VDADFKLYEPRHVTDFNEVTFHFLEVVYVHLSNIRAQVTTLKVGSLSITKGVYHLEVFSFGFDYRSVVESLLHCRAS
jgi:hypothetical protein